MSHFYGTLKGARGEATRCGTGRSGIETYAASWQGAVHVRLYQRGGVDMASVALAPWKGSGIFRPIYDGPVSGPVPPTNADRAEKGDE